MPANGRTTDVERLSGYFVGGTLFDKVTPEMTIYQEEVFGPVLVIVRPPLKPFNKPYPQPSKPILPGETAPPELCTSSNSC